MPEFLQCVKFYKTKFDLFFFSFFYFFRQAAFILEVRYKFSLSGISHRLSMQWTVINVCSATTEKLKEGR